MIAKSPNVPSFLPPKVPPSGGQVFYVDLYFFLPKLAHWLVFQTLLDISFCLRCYFFYPLDRMRSDQYQHIPALRQQIECVDYDRQVNVVPRNIPACSQSGERLPRQSALPIKTVVPKKFNHCTAQPLSPTLHPGQKGYSRMVSEVWIGKPVNSDFI